MSAELLTATDVAQLLRCSRSMIYKMHGRGLLPAPLQVFPGVRGARWVRQDIEEYVEHLRTVAAAENSSPRRFVPLDIRTI